ncbi:MAG TPA: FAD-dependent oxidoreductase [Methanomassiliicoccales archaeon]|nr:FAD-dependent oxidoreductase [Methanomassiliicoccales archaeon]
MDKFKYIVIGNSAAGIATIEGIRKLDSEGTIAVISDEDMYAYCRCLTSYYIKGKLTKDGLLFRPKTFYEDLKVTPFLGMKAVKIQPEENWVELEGGSKLGYDQLMLATGSSAVVYDMPGHDKKGVFTLRKFDDAEKIVKEVKSGKKAAVLGGGLVGLKSADALHARGMETYVIITSKQVMSQTMDPEGAKIIQERLEENSLHVITGNSVEEILGGDHVEGVRLSSGAVLEVDIVVFGKGVFPNIHLAADAGLETDYGILVDDHMRTNVANIYSAGDVAEAKDLINGGRYIHAIWPNAVEQGKVAGLNMAGGDVEYEGGMGMNSVELFGLPSISMGITKLRKPDDSYEFLSKSEPEKPYYRKIAIKNGRLVGAVCIGQVENAGIFAELIRQKIDVSEIKELLLDEDFDYAKLHDLKILDDEDMFVKAS